jgi:hypothetical protein
MEEGAGRKRSTNSSVCRSGLANTEDSVFKGTNLFGHHMRIRQPGFSVYDADSLIQDPDPAFLTEYRSSS